MVHYSHILFVFIAVISVVNGKLTLVYNNPITFDTLVKRGLYTSEIAPCNFLVQSDRTDDALSVELVSQMASDMGFLRRDEDNWFWPVAKVGVVDPLENFCDSGKWRISPRGIYIASQIANQAWNPVIESSFQVKIRSLYYTPLDLTVKIVFNTTTGLWPPLMGITFGPRYTEAFCEQGYYVTSPSLRLTSNSWIDAFSFTCTNGVTEKKVSLAGVSKDATSLPNPPCKGYYPGVAFEGKVYGTPVAARIKCLQDNPESGWVGIDSASFDTRNTFSCKPGHMVKGFMGVVDSSNYVYAIGISCEALQVSVSIRPASYKIERSTPYFTLDENLIKGSLSFGDLKSQALMLITLESSTSEWFIQCLNEFKEWIDVAFGEKISYLLLFSRKCRAVMLTDAKTPDAVHQVLVSANIETSFSIKNSTSGYIMVTFFTVPTEPTAIISSSKGLANENSNGGIVFMLVSVVFASFALLGSAGVFYYRNRNVLKLANLQSKSMKSSVGSTRSRMSDVNSSAASVLPRQNPLQQHGFGNSLQLQQNQSYHLGSNSNSQRSIQTQMNPMKSMLIPVNGSTMQGLSQRSHFLSPSSSSNKEETATSSSAQPAKLSSRSNGNTVEIEGTITLGFDAKKGNGILSVPGYLKMDAKSDFLILEKIAAGASGIVYKAIINKSNMTVALKFINDSDSAAFLFEVALMGSISAHPNIVGLVGWTELPNSIAMPIYNTSLVSVIKDASYDIKVQDAHGIAMDICKGLEYLHSIGIVHFDIKPKNVMVNIDDNSNKSKFSCAIGDFGNSKIIGSDINTDSLKLVKGLQTPDVAGVTIGYCAPEILVAFMKKNLSCSEIHKKGDVYSFAITLFEVLTRNNAWDAEDSKHLMKMIDAGERPILPDYLKDLSKEDMILKLLLEIIPKSWSQSPTDRPSFKELIKQLNVA